MERWREMADGNDRNGWRWLTRYRKCSERVKPYLRHVAVIVCRHAGIPGGGLLADILDQTEELGRREDRARLNELLEVVLEQGEWPVELGSNIKKWAHVHS